MTLSPKISEIKSVLRFEQLSSLHPIGSYRTHSHNVELGIIIGRWSAQERSSVSLATGL